MLLFRMVKPPRSSLLLFIAVDASLPAAGSHQGSNASDTAKMVLRADWCPQPEHPGFYAALVKVLGHGVSTTAEFKVIERKFDPAKDYPPQLVGANLQSGSEGATAWTF